MAITHVIKTKSGELKCLLPHQNKAGVYTTTFIQIQTRGQRPWAFYPVVASRLTDFLIKELEDVQYSMIDSYISMVTGEIICTIISDGKLEAQTLGIIEKRLAIFFTNNCRDEAIIVPHAEVAISITSVKNDWKNLWWEKEKFTEE